MRRAEGTRRGVGAREATHQTPPRDAKRFPEHRDWRERSTFVLNIRPLGPQDFHEAVCVRIQLAIATTNHDIVEIARKNSFGERGEFLSERFDVAVQASMPRSRPSICGWKICARTGGRTIPFVNGHIERDARDVVRWSDGPQIVSPSLHKAQWSLLIQLARSFTSMFNAINTCRQFLARIAAKTGRFSRLLAIGFFHRCSASFKYRVAIPVLPLRPSR